MIRIAKTRTIMTMKITIQNYYDNDNNICLIRLIVTTRFTMTIVGFLNVAYQTSGKTSFFVCAPQHATASDLTCTIVSFVYLNKRHMLAHL